MLTVSQPMRFLLLHLSLVFLALLAASASHAAVYRVTQTTDSNFPNPDPNILSLRNALSTANQHLGADQIVVPAGTYTLTLSGSGDNQNLTGDLDILDSVTITGSGPDKTIIDGNALDRVFDIPISSESISVVMNNLTIQNGKLTATNAYLGGGGICNRHVLTLNNVVVRSNSVAEAGGGGIQSDHDLTLNKVVVRDNRIDEVGDENRRTGGGILNNGFMVMTDSIVVGNQGRRGGGLYSHNASIERSLFTENRGWAGGAITSDGTQQLVNVTIHGNLADLAGAAIFVNYGVASLSFCTITDNLSGGFPAVYIDPSTSLALRNSILAANHSEANVILNCSPSTPPINSTYNLEDANTCGFSPATNLINTDPKLGPLQDNGGTTLTRALAADSPAIDYVKVDTGVTVDQRGSKRPVGPWADSGAYEYAQSPLCFPIKSPDGKTAVICL